MTQSGDFEADDTRRDRMYCVEATQGAVAGHPSDGEDMKTSKSALVGLVSLVIRKGHLDIQLPPYNPRGQRMAANSWNLSYGPPWAHYLGGYQDRLLGGPLGLPGLRYTAPDGVEHMDYGGEVLC
jgi:hypothetical protein